MKKINSLIALSLVFVLVLSFPVTALATGETIKLDQPQMADDEGRNAYKISFSASELPESISMLQANSDEMFNASQAEMAKNHNRQVAQQAKEFVRSLNLTESGYGYIEDFCLNELDYYMTMEDAQLTSYTVYTPDVKSNAVDKNSSPSESDLSYFGSYGGRDFYYFYPSAAGVKSNVQRQSSKNILQTWANNLMGCLMVFASTEVSALWSSFQLLMGAPDDYIIQNGAFTQSFCNLDVYTRGIYTQYGNGDYEILTSQQFCSVYPYMVFHPVDSPTYQGSYNKDYGYQGQAFSPKYKNSTSSLCKEAWQLFNGALVLNAHDKINTSAFNTFWEDL